jgi:hypothetical protein
MSTEPTPPEGSTECETTGCRGCVWCGHSPPPLAEPLAPGDLRWHLGANLGYAIGAVQAADGPGSCCARNLGVLTQHFQALADVATVKPDLYRQCLEFRDAHPDGAFELPRPEWPSTRALGDMTSREIYQWLAEHAERVSEVDLAMAFGVLRDRIVKVVTP